MAGSASFSWTSGSPEQIGRLIGTMADRAPDVVAEVAASEALRAETWMKAKAPWEDRTGNARQGLFGTSERKGMIVYMHVGGTEEYIPFLEFGTRYMRPRRIIIPAWRLWKVELPRLAGKALMEMFT